MRFYEKDIDTGLALELQDLAAALSGFGDLTFEYAYGSAIDIDNRNVTASTSWTLGQIHSNNTGLKTDVFLRTLGTLKHSDLAAMRSFMEQVESRALPKFATQVFSLFEDVRLEEVIKHERPGTTYWFNRRRQELKSYYSKQLDVNVRRGFRLDELFCLIYLLIETEGPDPTFLNATASQKKQLDAIKPHIFPVFEAKSTADIVQTVMNVMKTIEAGSGGYQDLINDYLVFPIKNLKQTAASTAFDELTRTDPLDNTDFDDPEADNNEIFNERFDTWHRENENEAHQQTFLQAELEHGTETSLIGDGARETEEGDQAMAAIQGEAGETDQNDYSDLSSIQEKSGAKREGNQGGAFGKDNRFAVAIEPAIDPPTDDDQNQFDAYAEDVNPYVRRLANTIEQMLEHKQTAPRQNLMAGRLSKNLTAIATDDLPRLFYKQDEADKEIDAAFTLLVDCSASMMNKMEETKKSVVLFHQVLKRLNIPHEIIGFWEDAEDVSDHYKPNYFQKVHRFSDSLYDNNGALIMQLKAQEDNRDGFSIRVARDVLLTRSEKHKFLLVFSDGEPAASDYDENGIVDTHLAVSETRKQHIDVIGLFLAEGEVTEQADSLMRNIYGRERILVPSAEILPEYFTPLLKKLMLKAM